MEEIRRLIEPRHRRISVARQCELLGLQRSSLYYEPAEEDAWNLQLMRWLDEQYLRTPFYGVARMTVFLRGLGHWVNAKRVRRLMRLMGLEAIYPKPRLSLQNKAHLIYPYLLKGVTISRPDQVWCTDITYIPMRIGWAYLVAVMDWHSRFVLAWELSTSLETSFCIEALRCALSRWRPGGPEIFNSDQGSQFTSCTFTDVLLELGVSISMDGRGRAYDNIFIERLWWSVKYEEVSLRGYDSVSEARLGLTRYFGFYNYERPHQALDWKTPAEVYGAGWRINVEGLTTPDAAASFALRAHDAAASGAGANPP